MKTPSPAQQRKIDKVHRDMHAKVGDTVLVRKPDGTVDKLRVRKVGLMNENNYRVNIQLSDGSVTSMFGEAQVKAICPADQFTRRFRPLQQLIRAIEQMQIEQCVPPSKRLDLLICTQRSYLLGPTQYMRYTLVDRRLGERLCTDVVEKSAGEFIFAPGASGWEETEPDQYEAHTKYMIGDVDVTKAVEAAVDMDAIERYC